MENKIELFSHQKTALALLQANDAYALFMEQGTGKTFPILFRLAELAQDKRITNALIVAPKAVCKSWKVKIEQLNSEQIQAIKSIDLQICSYDIVWRHNNITNASFDMVVFDEAHYIKTPSTRRTKACLKLAARAKYKYILTGTPISNGQLCNIWSEFTAIDPVVYTSKTNREYIYPACLGGTSYYKWLEEVAVLDRWHKPVYYRDVNKLQDIISEHSYRITKDECLELPEKLPDEILTCNIACKKLYNELFTHSTYSEKDYIAENPLTRLLKLRQVCSGYFVDSDSKIEKVPCNKIAALKDLLTDFTEPFVVFCEFTQSIENVCELLKRMEITYVVLNGKSKGDEWKTFQENPNIQAIVCQYASGAAGIDLYKASTCIFYEPTLRSELNEQAKDRIHRQGQHKPCSYYYLITENSIEQKIYDALCNYQDFTVKIFETYLKSYTKGQKL